MDYQDGNHIPPDEVLNFYNLLPKIYEDDDLWHIITHRWVDAFMAEHRDKVDFTSLSRVLNAGSGGLPCSFPEENVYHADITPKNLPKSERAFVADVQDLPFQDSFFNISVCVGSVINSCDAGLTIASLARVTKLRGFLFLEFETSSAWDYLFTRHFMQNATLVTTFYNHQRVRLWVYAERFIKATLQSYGFTILASSRTHIISPLIYRFTRNQNFSARFSRLDALFRHIPFLRRFCSNTIFLCQKSQEAEKL